MRDVIPTGTSRDSEFLFQQMTQRTLFAARPGAGRRILDVASGLGQDAMELARRGASVVAAEPSSRMSELAGLARSGDQQGDPSVLGRMTWLRCWSDALPFSNGSFDAVICKGALDHFDRPGAAIEEMARVTCPGGTVVLAIANFDSLSCRISRSLDRYHERWQGREPAPGRRAYDVPHDHFTRYELGLMREQASQFLELELVEGISLGWGVARWSYAVERLPGALAGAALAGLDWLARRAPAIADVVLLAGRPRHSLATSA